MTRHLHRAVGEQMSDYQYEMQDSAMAAQGPR